MGTATTGTVKSGGTAAPARRNCHSISLPARRGHRKRHNARHLAVIHGGRETQHMQMPPRQYFRSLSAVIGPAVISVLLVGCYVPNQKSFDSEARILVSVGM